MARHIAVVIVASEEGEDENEDEGATMSGREQ